MPFDVSPDYLDQLANVESAGDPMAMNPRSSAKGLYQFTDETAKQYGITDPFNADQQTQAVTRLTQNNAAALQGILGRDPTHGELYLAHQQGAHGAAKLLLNPDARAVDVLGRQKVLQNGGNDNMTAAAFANKWMSKFDQPELTSQTFTGGSSQDIGMADMAPADDKMALMLEAEKRGILPADQLAMLTEARSRGLIPALGGQPKSEPEAQKSPGILKTVLDQGTQGMTSGLADEGADRLSALAAAGITGRPYDEMLANARLNSKQNLASERENNPATATISNIAGAIASPVNYIPGVNAALRSGGLMARAGKALGSSVLQSGVYGAGASDEGNRVEGAEDAATSPLNLLAFGAVGAGAAGGRIIKGARDIIPQGVKDTVQRLRDVGISPRLSQITNGFSKNIDAVLPSIPFTGAIKSATEQGKQFVRALTGTFGKPSETLSPEFLDDAHKGLQSNYEDLLNPVQAQLALPRATGGSHILLDQYGNAMKAPADLRSNTGFIKMLKDKAIEIGGATDAAGREFLHEQVKNILNNIDDNGEMSGQAYQKVRSTLKAARATNPLVRGLQNVLDQGFRDSVPTDVSNQLSQIDGKWTNLRIAEDFVKQKQNSAAELGRGEISPDSLYAIAARRMSDIARGGGGNMGQLARDSRLLKQTVPNSGTPQRLVATGLMGLGGTGAALANPVTMAAAATPTIVGNVANRLMRARWLQNYMMNGLHRSALLNKIPAALRDVPSNILPGMISSNLAVQNSAPLQITVRPSDDPNRLPAVNLP